MRREYCPFSSRLVSAALCRLVVTHLALADYKRSVPADLLARALLLCGCLHRSLSWVACHCRACPSDESLRKALLDNLPGEDLLLARLLQMLHALPSPLAQRPWPCAIDLHLRPYYGDKDTPGTSGGAREAGTDRFWAYATLALLVKGRRYTIGLVRVDRRQPSSRAVQTLLDQAQQAGVRLQYALLDRGFYDAEVIHLLQQQGLPFVMPMIRRGQEARQSGTTRFFQRGRATGWYGYGWTARPRRLDEQTGHRRKTAALAVEVKVCVWRRGAKKRPWVFVAWGVSWPPPLVAKRYRTRFGIETSYRQVGEVLGVTTSKDVRVRLLLLGLALLVRQYWCWVHDEVLGQGNESLRHRQQRWRLADLKMWLILAIARTLAYDEEIAIPPPPPRRAA